MADKRIDQLVAAMTIGDDDLLVLQQNNQAKKLSGKKLGDYVYAAAAGKVAEVEQAVADAQSAIDDLEEQKDTIAQAVAAMADLGTDTTLTTAGMAADAEATGNKINGAETAALGSFDQAEITGAAIATFDDGADNIPVKALEIAIDPVQDLHGQANPYPAGGGKNKFDSSIFDSYNVTDIRYVSYQVDNGTYTMSSPDFPVTQQTSNVFFIAGQASSGASSSINGVWANKPITITVTDGYYTVAYRAYSTSNDNRIKNFKWQIESGSSATTWQPYSNICPITGWTEAKIPRTGKNLLKANIQRTLTPLSVTLDTSIATWIKANTTYYFSFDVRNATSWRVCAILFDANGNRLFSNGVVSNAVITNGTYFGENLSGQYYVWGNNASSKQTRFNFNVDCYVQLYFNLGDTSENTVFSNCQLELAQFTDYEPYTGATYSLTFPSAAGTVYGAKLINEGTEMWKLRVTHFAKTFDSTLQASEISAPLIPTGQSTFKQVGWNAYNDIGIKNAIFMSDRFKYTGGSGLYVVYPSQSAPRLFMGLPLTVETKQDAIDFFTNNPTTMIYPIATPVEYTITGEVVRTLLGLNNIWADTGNILDLIYRKQPISVSDIQENIDAVRDIIADREDSGIASKNYSFGALIIIGNNLYEAIGPIATGESIVPGSNCTATTVSEQIASIKSIINSLGNLAYLSYENA